MLNTESVVRPGMPGFARATRGVLIVLVACAGDDGVASVLRVPDDPACSACLIRSVTEVALVIPPALDHGLPLALRRDNSGRYWLFRVGQVPLLFDSHGVFTQSVGRLGSGPGEFIGAAELLSVADTVIVLDGRARRATVLDSTTNLVRTLSLPFGVHAAVVDSWPGSVVVNGVVALEGSNGVLHRASFAGGNATIVSSFRAERDSTNPQMVMQSRHHITRTASGEVWTAWESAYDLRRWTVDGRLLGGIERRPSWFAGVAPFSYDWRNVPPPSYVGGLLVDSNGLLWVYLKVASVSWKQAWAHAPPNVGEAAPIHELLHSTMIEVIDVEKGRVLARLPIESYLIGPVGGDGVAFLETDEKGEQRIIVRMFELARR